MTPYEDNGTDEAIKAALVAYEKQMKAGRKEFIRNYVSRNAEYYTCSATCVQKACELWDALQKAGC